MNDQDIIDAEYADAEQSGGLPAQHYAGSSPVLGSDPTTRMQTAEQLVQHMASKCSGPNYVVNIQGNSYPKVEWWTTVGAALDLFPQEESCQRYDRADESYAYEAVVGVYTSAGKRITRAGGLCASHEGIGKNGEHAVRSMAVTRATVKAYRLGLSFIAVMAQLQATPAEEMPQQGGAQKAPQSQPQQQAPPQQQQAPAQNANNGTGTYQVTNVRQLKTGETQNGPWTLWGIDTQGGITFKTFQDARTNIAQQAMNQGQGVTIQWSYEQRNGYDNYMVQDIQIAGGQSQPTADQPQATNDPSSPAAESANVTIKNVREEQRRLQDQSLISVWIIETNEAGEFGTKEQAVADQAKQFINTGQLVSIRYTNTKQGAKKALAVESDDPF